MNTDQTGFLASHGIRRFTIFMVLTFIASQVFYTIVCVCVWGACVTDNLYHCTDPGFLDYLAGPNDWVHGKVAGKPGDYGDTIKAGWSLEKLEALWSGFIAASVIASVLTTWAAAHARRNAHFRSVLRRGGKKGS